ncbi:MAG: hypothetical protein WC369_08070 [Dehalococcoidales bacterium]|jgi:uncharacterized protein YpmS
MIKSLTIASTVIAVLVIAGGLYLALKGDSEEVPVAQENEPALTSAPAASETVKTPVPVSEPASATVTPSSGQQAELPPALLILGESLTFDQKVEGLKQVASEVCATGQSREVRLVFSEEEANQKAAELLAGNEIETDIPLEVIGVKVYFLDDNRVLAEVKASIASLKPTIKVETSVSLKDGEPEVEITRMSFGFIPLPGAVKEKLSLVARQQIDSIISSYRGEQMGCDGRIKLEFNDIEIKQAEASVTLTVRRI